MRGSVTTAGLALALAAWGAAAQSKPDGAALYNARCALCHGRDGRPTPAIKHAKVPSFADPEWQKGRSDEALRKAIAEGSPGTLMRAFKSELRREEMEALLQYLRSLGKPR
jgi:mono/diheme cytochrome c family protein